MKIVYVVSYSPSVGSQNAVGGFDWYFTRASAISALTKELSTLPEFMVGMNYALTEIPVSEKWSDEEITEKIGDNLDMVEVSNEDRFTFNDVEDADNEQTRI